MSFTMSRRLVAEAVGTALLLATVVGSGIMGETLADGNDAVALLGNTLATAAILVVLILVFGPISGAHFNPAVTLSFVLQKAIEPRAALAYVAVQVAGGIAGVVLAHAMFDQPAFQVSVHSRTGPGQWLAEAVATFGLVLTILGCLRFRAAAVPYGVGLFIAAGYWFTSSTSFANPAVTIARSLTDSFSGIAPPHVAAFIVCQLIGSVVATVLVGWMLARAPSPETAAALD